MSILEYLRTQGEKPKRQRMRGDPPPLSVEGKRRKKFKQDADRATRPAGMATSGNPYRSKVQSKAKVGDRFGAAKTTKKATGVYPRTKGSYKIKKGDTLSGIAKKSGTTVAALMKLNPGLKDPNKIRAGAGLNLGTKGTQAPKNIKRPVKKDFKENLPPYDTRGAFKKGGKVIKAVKGSVVRYLTGVVTREGKKVPARMSPKQRRKRIQEITPTKKQMNEMVAAEMKKRKKDDRFSKTGKLTAADKFDAKKFGIDINKKSPDAVRAELEDAFSKRALKDRASSYEPRFKSKGGMLKDPPAGKKGKGLRKLPTAVRNKMGYKKRGGMLRMSGGGSASGYGRAAMRPGKDPRSISKT